jgi:hypothetical protein
MSLLYGFTVYQGSAAAEMPKLARLLLSGADK